MKTYTLAHNLKLIDVSPPISGFQKFLGTYVLRAGEVALIDVGPSVSIANLISGLAELNIKPAEVSFIFISHIHLDHAGGVGKAIKQLPNAKVVVHEKGGPHLIDPTSLWADSQRVLGDLAEKYEALDPVPEDRVIIAKDGMLFDLGDMEIEVLETPGHASHHLCFWNKKEGRLFAGEAASNHTESVGLIRPGTPFPFNLENTLNSLDRIIRLAPTSLCYAHFGCVDQPLDKMQQARQQLITWGKTVAGCMETAASHQDMYLEIRKNDAMLDRLDSLPADQRDRELYFINNSIRGLASYFERFGTGYIQAVPLATPENPAGNSQEPNNRV